MLWNDEIDHIVVESKNEEEEDINVYYINGNVLYIQVKTKRKGVWNFNEFFKRVFDNFFEIFHSSEEEDKFHFSFISNAPPEDRLATFLYEIQPNLTIKNFYDQMKKIDRISNKNIELFREWDTSDIMKILSHFKPCFSYISSDDPNKPEKYIVDYVKQKIRLKCGKSKQIADQIFDSLHTLSFEKSRYNNREQRIITRQDLSNIVSPCVPYEERWKDELNRIFPQEFSDIFYDKILFGEFNNPKFHKEYKMDEECYNIDLILYSKNKMLLFKMMPQTWSHQARNEIKRLNRQLNGKMNAELICITKIKHQDCPANITMFSTDKESLKEFKAFFE